MLVLAFKDVLGRDYSYAASEIEIDADASAEDRARAAARAVVEAESRSVLEVRERATVSGKIGQTAVRIAYWEAQRRMREQQPE